MYKYVDRVYPQKNTNNKTNFDDLFKFFYFEKICIDSMKAY